MGLRASKCCLVYVRLGVLDPTLDQQLTVLDTHQPRHHDLVVGLLTLDT